MAKNKVLITGANGFLGKALVKKLMEENNDLYLVSRDKNFSMPNTQIFYGDLADQDFCKKIVADIDSVYYLAGYKKNISYHTKNPSEFLLGNVEPLMSFLKAVKGSGIKKIIYMSSASVGLYKEGESDGYVIGKYINELILKAFAKESKIDIKIVRSPGIYGPGDNFNPETANFIPAMIQKVYESDKEISVWGKGDREIQFIFVDDLVKNLLEVSKESGEFFALGNPEALTINQIVEKIIKLSGKDLYIKNDETKPDKPSQLFEFTNPRGTDTSFDEGLKQTIKYYKNLKK